MRADDDAAGAAVASPASAPTLSPVATIVSLLPPRLLPPAAAADGPEPEYKADSEYPPWLFKVLDEKPLLEDYIMKGLENVPPAEMKMVQRMISKRGIKAGNNERRKD